MSSSNKGSAVNSALLFDSPGAMATRARKVAAGPTRRHPTQAVAQNATAPMATLTNLALAK